MSSRFIPYSDRASHCTFLLFCLLSFVLCSVRCDADAQPHLPQLRNEMALLGYTSGPCVSVVHLSTWNFLTSFLTALSALCPSTSQLIHPRPGPDLQMMLQGVFRGRDDR